MVVFLMSKILDELQYTDLNSLGWLVKVYGV